MSIGALAFIGSELQSWFIGEGFSAVKKEFLKNRGDPSLFDRLKVQIERFSKISTLGENNHVVEKLDKIKEFLKSKHELMSFTNQTEGVLNDLEKNLNSLMLDLLLDKSFNLTSNGESRVHILTKVIEDQLVEGLELKRTASSMLCAGKFKNINVILKKKRGSDHHADENFYLEALILQILNEKHMEGIIGFYGVDNVDCPTVIVLELGKCTLAEHLASNPLCPLYERLGYLSDTCNVIAYLVDKEILHRDIKPENVLIMFNNSIKLINFGFVKSKDINMSTGSTLKGTHSYVAPELLMCTGPNPILKEDGTLADAQPGTFKYSEATDMYSFALMMNYVLTNVKPFDRYSHTQLIGLMFKSKGMLRPDVITESAYPGNEGVCKGLAGLISLCWDATPALRLQFSQLSTRLEALTKICHHTELEFPFDVNSTVSPGSDSTSSTTTSDCS